MTEINKKTHYPVDSAGDMLEEDYYYTRAGQTWSPMWDFVATLSFVEWQKGRSSLRFIVQDSEGKTYSMMASSITEFVNNSVNGKVCAVWEFVKRGSYYGIQIKEVLG